jgi:hypothetical protein
MACSSSEGFWRLGLLAAILLRDGELMMAVVDDTGLMIFESIPGG